ncbi:hypothetical protein K458DRAFT_148730 [Lentithecium fluviatile CBS 122367]|uniref:Uncharacterized protein n=1 Tax=Lentithecium fluviatile CBS 122367 TaxID=1168545 RepID=A0A6G1JE40_9PLEO|nr:hypothetical protein K458DRAFT_148730 [Lentithecium fluviatile CBS 122367]
MQCGLSFSRKAPSKTPLSAVSCIMTEGRRRDRMKRYLMNKVYLASMAHSSPWMVIRFALG